MEEGFRVVRKSYHSRSISWLSIAAILLIALLTRTTTAIKGYDGPVRHLREIDKKTTGPYVDIQRIYDGSSPMDCDIHIVGRGVKEAEVEGQNGNGGAAVQKRGEPSFGNTSPFGYCALGSYSPECNAIEQLPDTSLGANKPVSNGVRGISTIETTSSTPNNSTSFVHSTHEAPSAFCSAHSCTGRGQDINVMLVDKKECGRQYRECVLDIEEPEGAYREEIGDYIAVITEGTSKYPFDTEDHVKTDYKPTANLITSYDCSVTSSCQEGEEHEFDFYCYPIHKEPLQYNLSSVHGKQGSALGSDVEKSIFFSYEKSHPLHCEECVLFDDEEETDDIITRGDSIKRQNEDSVHSDIEGPTSEYDGGPIGSRKEGSSAHSNTEGSTAEYDGSSTGNREEESSAYSSTGGSTAGYNGSSTGSREEESSAHSSTGGSTAEYDDGSVDNRKESSAHSSTGGSTAEYEEDSEKPKTPKHKPKKLGFRRNKSKKKRARSSRPASLPSQYRYDDDSSVREGGEYEDRRKAYGKKRKAGNKKRRRMSQKRENKNKDDKFLDSECYEDTGPQSCCFPAIRYAIRNVLRSVSPRINLNYRGARGRFNFRFTFKCFDKKSYNIGGNNNNLSI